MPTRIEAIWEELRLEKENEHVTEGVFKLRLVDEQRATRIYAGITQRGDVMLAIGVKARPPEISLTSRALEYFRQSRQDSSWLMVLRLLQPNLQPVFGRLCQDLVDEAGPDVGEPDIVALFRERLELWQRLFEEASGGALEKHRVKGLIAELLTLEDLLQQNGIDDAEVVTGWRGPGRADQDFQFSDRAVEVKAIAPGAKEVSISSLGQLCAAVPIELRILTMRDASPQDNSSVNLPTLVARLEGRLSANSACLGMFRRKVREAGYFEDAGYEEICFVLKGVSRYGVSAAFPKLTAAHVPEGVSKATYSLKLQAIESFVANGIVCND